MNPEAAKAGLTVALFVAVASALILPLETPGSAEFVVNVLALGIGILATGVIAFVIRRSSH
jgi:preprotein translocase subunit Sss1